MVVVIVVILSSDKYKEVQCTRDTCWWCYVPTSTVYQGYVMVVLCTNK